MKRINCIVLMMLLAATPTIALANIGNKIASPKFSGVQVAEFCSLTGSEVSGLNKICYYNCVSGRKAITIAGWSVCPVTNDL